MATMYTGMGGPQGYGSGSFIGLGAEFGNLDDGSIQIDLTSVFGPAGLTFYGQAFTSAYLNTNGTLTFDGPNLSYIPTGISGVTEPMIAPFFTDIDITGGSATGMNNIYWDLNAINGTFTVTWLQVAPYDGAGTNSFQMRISDLGSGEYDLEFLYEDIQFGDGYPAQNADATTGFTDGGANVVELPGSGNEAILLGYETQNFETSDPLGHFSQEFQSTGLPTCFVASTLIDTLNGSVPAETLRAGQWVNSLHNGPVKLVWVGHSHHSLDNLRQQTQFWPISFEPGSLGPDMPQRRLTVSPHHRILCANPVVQRMFDAPQVLVPAKALVDLPGVAQMAPRAAIHYCHLLFQNHKVILANGAYSESLLIGPQSLRSIGPSARHELCTQFPDLYQNGQWHCPTSQHKLVPVTRAKNLVSRCLRNNHPLVTTAPKARPQVTADITGTMPTPPAIVASQGAAIYANSLPYC